MLSELDLLKNENELLHAKIERINSNFNYIIRANEDRDTVGYSVIVTLYGLVVTAYMLYKYFKGC